MHIMEGFLPAPHAIAWGGAAILCVGTGLHSINRAIKGQPELKMLLGVAAAFTFILSALKLPSLTGSCSHPTGTGLGAILFGPLAMAPVAAIVLLFQALLLAHGGLTTLGANIISMGVIGPTAGYACYCLGRRCALPIGFTVFIAAMVADLSTFCTTALQLAIAFPDPLAGISAALVKFLGVFAITQIPLAISEGFLTLLIFNFMQKYSGGELSRLGFNLNRSEGQP